MLTSILFLLALPAQILALVLHDSIESVPAGWSVKSVPSSEDTINLEVALTQSNITEMVTALYDVSTPSSPNYGKYWTKSQVDALIASSTEAKEATISWLKSGGVEHIYDAGNYIRLQTTVSIANKLLNTTFAHYTNEAGASKLRTTKYSVGEEVAEHIEFISPTTFFGRTTGHRATPVEGEASKIVEREAVASSCVTGLTPACVKELYGVPVNYKPKTTAGAYSGFGSFLNQSAIYSDLFLFEKKYNLMAQNISTTIFPNGANYALSTQNITLASELGSSGEANLDMQNIVGLVNPIPVIEFITGGSPPDIPDLSEPTAADNENEPYLPYYQALLAMTDEELPQSISNSYGDDEQTVPFAYATHVCNLIGMMGLRGITVLESSGDLGVGAYCQSNKGKKLPRFNPIFPATCPYITAVGGLQDLPQIAWVGSSGGFSDYFARPSYQQTAVNTYLDDYVTASTALYYSNYANFSGRGFPDVSAMSVTPYYYGFYSGELALNGGTSAAAPVLNGIVTLLNAELLAAGKPTLGFMNPWLYGGGYEYFTDIKKGQSIGCNGYDTQSGEAVPGPVIPYAFWNATVGWDPVTGWGAPAFSKIKKALLK